MSTAASHTSAAGRETVLAKALAFFDRNPDEVLLREDICLKWDCCPRTAKAVARALIREGVPRAQLPRSVKPSRAKKPPAAFPDCLTASEVRAIYAMHRYGTISAAAAAYELSVNTITTQLRDARRKAGVRQTSVLVQMFLASEGEQSSAPAPNGEAARA